VGIPEGAVVVNPHPRQLLDGSSEVVGVQKGQPKRLKMRFVEGGLPRSVRTGEHDEEWRAHPSCLVKGLDPPAALADDGLRSADAGLLEFYDTFSMT